MINSWFMVTVIEGMIIPKDESRVANTEHGLAKLERLLHKKADDQFRSVRLPNE